MAKQIQITNANLVYHLDDLSEWAEGVEYHNISVLSSSAATRIRELEKKVRELEGQVISQHG